MKDLVYVFWLWRICCTHTTTVLKVQSITIQVIGPHIILSDDCACVARNGTEIISWKLNGVLRVVSALGQKSGAQKRLHDFPTPRQKTKPTPFFQFAINVRQT